MNSSKLLAEYVSAIREETISPTREEMFKVANNACSGHWYGRAVVDALRDAFPFIKPREPRVLTDEELKTKHYDFETLTGSGVSLDDVIGFARWAVAESWPEFKTLEEENAKLKKQLSFANKVAGQACVNARVPNSTRDFIAETNDGFRAKNAFIKRLEEENKQLRTQLSAFESLIEASSCPPDVPPIEWMRSLYKNLETANEMRSEIERLKKKGEELQAATPAECPITHRPFFMVIEHPERGLVPTYGGPYDSYTIPEWEPVKDERTPAELYCERFDHDEGGWIEGVESIDWYVTTDEHLANQAEQLKTALAENETRVRELLGMLDNKQRGFLYNKRARRRSAEK